MGKHGDFHLRFFQIVGVFRDFRNFKSLYGFGDAVSKLDTLVVDFEPYFKVHNLVSVHPKSIIVVQMTNLYMIFHVMVSVYRLVKI